MAEDNEDENVDITQELYDWQYITDNIQGKAVMVMLSGAVFGRAADEIRQLRDLADKFAEGIRTGRWDDALDAYEEYNAR